MLKQAKLQKYLSIALAFLFTIATSEVAYGYDSITATISGFSGAYGLAIAPNGSYAYVGNYTIGTVSRVNLSTNSIVATITLPNINNREIAFEPSGAYAYACSGTTLVKIRTSDNSTSNISIAGCQSLAMDPNGQFMYISSTGATLQRLNLSNDAITTYTLTGYTLYGGAITPNGQYAYFANLANNNVVKIRTSDNTVVGSVGAVGALPNIIQIALSPDGTTGIATGLGSANLNKRFSTVTDTFTYDYTGGNAQAAAFSADGSYAYLANIGTGKLVKIRMSDNSMSNVANVTTASYYLAINSANGVAVVTNYNASTIFKVDATPTVSSSSISISAPSTANFRSAVSITATLGTAGTDGKVTFFADGKRIGGCINILSNSLSATCTYKASKKGAIRIYAALSPSNSAIPSSTSTTATIAVAPRSSTR